jgi:transposase
MPPTNILRCWPGWPSIRDGRSHFTPTSCSWLNAVEGFFSKLTRQSLKRGVFRSVDDLESAITRYIAATNRNPKPFVWTATAKTIQAKLTLNHPSESVH